jgi:hypothetical protein
MGLKLSLQSSPVFISVTIGLLLHLIRWLPTSEGTMLIFLLDLCRLRSLILWLLLHMSPLLHWWLLFLLCCCIAPLSSLLCHGLLLHWGWLRVKLLIVISSGLMTFWGMFHFWCCSSQSCTYVWWRDVSIVIDIFGGVVKVSLLLGWTALDFSSTKDRLLLLSRWLLQSLIVIFLYYN